MYKYDIGKILDGIPYWLSDSHGNTVAQGTTQQSTTVELPESVAEIAVDFHQTPQQKAQALAQSPLRKKYPLVFEVPVSALGGVLNAGQEVLDTTHDMAGWLDEHIVDLGVIRFSHYAD